jgi:hypothetical protein
MADEPRTGAGAKGIDDRRRLRSGDRSGMRMSDVGRGGCRPIALTGRCVGLEVEVATTVGQRPGCGRGGSAGGRGGLGGGGGFGRVAIISTSVVLLGLVSQGGPYRIGQFVLCILQIVLVPDDGVQMVWVEVGLLLLPD